MKEALLTKIQKAVIYFVLYSVIGWCYEVFLEVVVYRWGFSNRGVLLGPYCVVYGFGALIWIVVITTLVELAASYIMEFTHGEWLWDYTRFAFNFQGRVALNPSIRFGIGGMIFLYLLQPLFQKLTTRMSKRALAAVSGALTLLLLADTVYTFILRG